MRKGTTARGGRTGHPGRMNAPAALAAADGQRALSRPRRGDRRLPSPILAWYRDRGILVSVDAIRSAPQVGREILTALEAMRPLLDHVPAHARRPG